MCFLNRGFLRVNTAQHGDSAAVLTEQCSGLGWVLSVCPGRFFLSGPSVLLDLTYHSYTLAHAVVLAHLGIDICMQMQHLCSNTYVHTQTYSTVWPQAAGISAALRKAEGEDTTTEELRTLETNIHKQSICIRCSCKSSNIQNFLFSLMATDWLVLPP